MLKTNLVFTDDDNYLNSFKIISEKHSITNYFNKDLEVLENEKAFEILELKNIMREIFYQLVFSGEEMNLKAYLWNLTNEKNIWILLKYFFDIYEVYIYKESSRLEIISKYNTILEELIERIINLKLDEKILDHDLEHFEQFLELEIFARIFFKKLFEEIVKDEEKIEYKFNHIFGGFFKIFVKKFNEYKLEKIFLDAFVKRFFEKFQAVERASLNWNHLFAKNDSNDYEACDTIHQEPDLPIANLNKPSCFEKIKIQIENIIKYIYNESLKCNLKFICDSLMRFCIENRIILLEEKNRRTDRNKQKGIIFKENNNDNEQDENNLDLSENIEPENNENSVDDQDKDSVSLDYNEKDSESLSKIIDERNIILDKNKIFNKNNTNKTKIMKIKNKVKNQLNKSINNINEEPILLNNKRGRTSRFEKGDENNKKITSIKRNSRELNITKNSEKKNIRKASLNKRLIFDERNNDIQLSPKKLYNTSTKRISKSPNKLKVSKEKQINNIRKSTHQIKKLENKSKIENLNLNISPKKSNNKDNHIKRVARKIENNELSYQSPQKLRSSLRKIDLSDNKDLSRNQISQRTSPQKDNSVYSKSLKIIKPKESSRKKTKRSLPNNYFDKIQDSIRLKKSKSITSSRSNSRSPSICSRENSYEVSPFSARHSSRIGKINLDLTKINEKLKTLKNETPTKKNNRINNNQNSGKHQNRELKSLELENISLNTPRDRTPEKLKSPLKNITYSDKKTLEFKTPLKRNSSSKKERKEKIRFGASVSIREFDPKTPVKSLSFNIKNSPRMKNNLINKKSNLKKPICAIEKYEHKILRSASKTNSPLNSNKKRKFS